MNRSGTVGMPSVRVPFPSGFGISTCLIGCGTYLPTGQLFPYPRPTLLKVRGQGFYGHPVYAWRSLIRPITRLKALLQVLPMQYLLHQHRALPVGCSPLPLQTFDAPSPCSHGFHPLPSGSPPASQPSFLHLPRLSRLQHPSSPTRSGLRSTAAKLLCPQLTSARSSPYLVITDST